MKLEIMEYKSKKIANRDGPCWQKIAKKVRPQWQYCRNLSNFAMSFSSNFKKSIAIGEKIC